MDRKRKHFLDDYGDADDLNCEESEYTLPILNAQAFSYLAFEWPCCRRIHVAGFRDPRKTVLFYQQPSSTVE